MSFDIENNVTEEINRNTQYLKENQENFFCNYKSENVSICKDIFYIIYYICNYYIIIIIIYIYLNIVLIFIIFIKNGLIYQKKEGTIKIRREIEEYLFSSKDVTLEIAFTTSGCDFPFDFICLLKPFFRA